VRALQRRQERRSTFSHDPVARERAKQRAMHIEGVRAEIFVDLMESGYPGGLMIQVCVIQAFNWL